MGLGYLALSSHIGRPLLRPEDQDAGLVPAVVAQEILGTQGALLILVIVVLAVISTASAEVMAVTSIIVHDLYEVYFKVSKPQVLFCKHQRADRSVCVALSHGGGRQLLRLVRKSPGSHGQPCGQGKIPWQKKMKKEDFREKWIFLCQCECISKTNCKDCHYDDA
jgi:hypothetical protein